MQKVRKWLVPTSGVVALACLLMSCQGGADAEKKDEIRDTSAVSPPSPQVDDGDISYVLPSPVQVADIFKKAGLRYYSGITNNTSNAAGYKAGNIINKALNLGVYSADLSYCALNNQSQESKNYFKVCRDLAADLGLAKAFEVKDVAQRLEKNISSQDSLALILADIQMETDNLLSESNQEYISVVSFTGAWIESMYIGIQVHSKEKNTAIASELVQQMSIAENVIKALKAHASRDASINELVQKMSSLNEIYNSFKSVQEIKATDPDVIDATKLNISITELYSFSQRLEEIRNSIIKA